MVLNKNCPDITVSVKCNCSRIKCSVIDCFL